MRTTDVQFELQGQTWAGPKDVRYSLDQIIELIRQHPREIEQLDLTGWRTARLPDGPFDEICSFLVSPTGVEHFFKPSNLKNAKTMPVIVFQKRGHTFVVDGVHRLVNAIRRGRKNYPVVVVTPREIGRCVLQPQARQISV